MFSTSTVASVVFTIFFWILGYLGCELKFLSSKIGNIFLKVIVKFFFYIIPNFQYLNFRDRYDNLNYAIFAPVAYTFVYSAVCIIICAVLFSEKEF